MGTIGKINRHFCRYWLNPSNKSHISLKERTEVAVFFKEHHHLLADAIVFYKFESGLDYYAPIYVEYIQKLYTIIAEWNTLLERVCLGNRLILKSVLVNEIITFLRNNDIREYGSYRFLIGSAILNKWRQIDSNDTILRVLYDIIENEKQNAAFLFTLGRLSENMAVLCAKNVKKSAPNDEKPEFKNHTEK
jgi:hypothetical protein